MDNSINNTMEYKNFDTERNQLPNTLTSVNQIKKPTKEVLITANDGCCMTLVNFLFLCLCIAIIVVASISWMNVALRISALVFSSILLLVSLCCCCGVSTVNPNQGIVVTFCGRYRGTIKENGCIWVLPCFGTKRISYKSNNFETHTLKINDLRGNPIEVGAVITWKIFDSYKASFEVMNLTEYVKCQSESAIRKLVSKYPYDKVHDEVCLKDGNDDVHLQLVEELQNGLEKAGVTVEEAKFNHMAYAKEIAQVMLRRQQADSIIAAREKIIMGAVGIVGMAIESLKQNSIEEMTNDEKVRIVSNLLIVMCSENQNNSVIMSEKTDVKSQQHHTQQIKKIPNHLQSNLKKINWKA